MGVSPYQGRRSGAKVGLRPLTRWSSRMRRFYCCSEWLTRPWPELPFSTPPVKTDRPPEVLRRCRRRRSEHGGHALEYLRALLLAHLRRLVAHQFGRYPAAGGGHLSLLIVATELHRDGDPAFGG